MNPSRLLLVLLLPAALWAQDIKWAPTPQQVELLKTRVDSQWPKFSGADLRKGMGSQEASYFILNAAAVGYDPARIEVVIDWLSRFQETNLANKNPWNFYWYWGDTVVKDANAVQFNMRIAVFVWTHYRDRLNESGRKKLEALLRRSVEGVRKQAVRVSYSNIYLMKIFNLIALGEALGLPGVAEEGYRNLDQWIAFTWDTGVAEYLSPTYYAVDIENLALVRNFAKDAAGRAAAERALVYLWNEVMLNWYAPGGRLGGAHSRDYDRLTGHGGLDRMVACTGYAAGGAIDPPMDAPFDRFSFWAPPASALAPETRVLPRFIHQRWGGRFDTPFETAEQYLGKAFSIASATANYWDMDKAPLVVNLGPGEDVPQILYYMDGRGDWYGKKKIMERSGHMKSLHLKPFIASVQNGPEVLCLASIANATNEELTQVESILTLPADAEYWTNQGRLALNQKTSTWAMNPAGDDIETFIDAISEAGQVVLRIRDTSPRVGVGVQRRVPVTPGRSYRQAAFFKGGLISLYINWLDANGRLIGGENIKDATGSSQYAWAEQIQKAPANAATALVWIYSKAAAVTEVAFKDLRFEDLGASSGGKAPSNLVAFDFTPASAVSRIAMAKSGTLFVRRGDAALAIKLLAARGSSGEEVPWMLIGDGLPFGALRLTATQDTGRSGRRVSSALWARAEEGLASEAAFASWRAKILAVKATVEGKYDGEWKLASAGPSGALALQVDLASEKVLSRTGMAKGYEPHLLSANGRDVGREILKDLPAVKAVLAGFPSGRIPKPIISILSNGALETAAGQAFPSGWQPHFAPDGKATFLEALKENGTNLVKITDRSEKAGVGFIQWVPVTPGHRYRLSAQLRGGGLALYLNWHDASKKLLTPEHNTSVRGGEGKFAPVALEEVAVEKAAFVQVWFYSSRSGQTESWVASPALEDLGK
ncbi:MAG: hypothetical protein J0L75_12675 [Spirochaetes bacterium]|nr:hypothetical protein [Spirochaetota bacterium]